MSAANKNFFLPILWQSDVSKKRHRIFSTFAKPPFRQPFLWRFCASEAITGPKIRLNVITGNPFPSWHQKTSLNLSKSTCFNEFLRCFDAHILLCLRQACKKKQINNYAQSKKLSTHFVAAYTMQSQLPKVCLQKINTCSYRNIILIMIFIHFLSAYSFFALLYSTQFNLIYSTSFRPLHFVTIRLI